MLATITHTRESASVILRPVSWMRKNTYPQMVQTDAAINPGNSGRPLLNLQNEFAKAAALVLPEAAAFLFLNRTEMVLDHHLHEHDLELRAFHIKPPGCT